MAATHTPRKYLDQLDLRGALFGTGVVMTHDREGRYALYQTDGQLAQALGTFGTAREAWSALDRLDAKAVPR